MRGGMCPSCGNPVLGPPNDAECDDYNRHVEPDEVPDEYWEDEEEFADPGGRSALRAASPTNPRNLPCPTCGAPDRLTPADRARGYQCDSCADRAEGIYMGGDY
jgi:hypothetical protein